MKNNKLNGTGVALVTPFDNTGNIDLDGLTRLVSHVSQGGVEYLVVCGTTGETVTMSMDEQAEVLSHVRKHNPKELPIVFGMGSSNTAGLIGQLKEVDFDGISAVLSASPAYNKPSQEGIAQHYEAFADACPVPVILYNVPGRTASNMSATTTLRLAKHGNIIGMKEASGDLGQCMAIAKRKPKDFMLISGDDMLASSIIALGGCGVISVLANAFPRDFSDMIRLALSNDLKAASVKLLAFADLNPLMYSESNPVGVKQALAHLGICGADVRLPLVQGSEKLRKDIDAAIREM